MLMSLAESPSRSRRSSFGRDAYQQALVLLQTKQNIIGELIQGRLTLLEASTRFSEAERNGQPEWRTGEEVCRAVIGWVHLALNDRPERAEAISQGLEQQLQAHLARFGSLRLLPS